MFFVGGIGDKAENCGQISGIYCKNCGKERDFALVKTYSYGHVFFIPLLKYNTHYFLTCASCGTTYEISKELGTELRQNPFVTKVNPSVMYETGKGHFSTACGICPKCGKKVDSNDTFCRNCGEKLQ